MYVRLLLCLYSCTYVCMCVCVYICRVCMYICMYIYMYVYIYVCMYVRMHVFESHSLTPCPITPRPKVTFSNKKKLLQNAPLLHFINKTHFSTTSHFHPFDVFDSVRGHTQTPTHTHVYIYTTHPHIHSTNTNLHPTQSPPQQVGVLAHHDSIVLTGMK